jgi:hypothetical protein
MIMVAVWNRLPRIGLSGILFLRAARNGGAPTEVIRLLLFDDISENDVGQLNHARSLAFSSISDGPLPVSNPSPHYRRCGRRSE